MKKILINVVGIALMSTSVMAWDITNSPVKSMSQDSVGVVAMTLSHNGVDVTKLLNITDPDSRKSAIAMALTALTAGLNVNAVILDGKISKLTIIQAP